MHLNALSILCRLSVDAVIYNLANLNFARWTKLAGAFIVMSLVPPDTTRFNAYGPFKGSHKSITLSPLSTADVYHNIVHAHQEAVLTAKVLKWDNLSKLTSSQKEVTHDIMRGKLSQTKGLKQTEQQQFGLSLGACQNHCCAVKYSTSFPSSIFH